MTLRFLLFLITHLAVLLAAQSHDSIDSQLYGYVYPGVVSSQFALLGIWLGVGGSAASYRIATALLGCIALCGLSFLRSPVNPWELLYELVRLPVLGLFFLAIRRKRGLVLKQTGRCADGKLFRTVLPHLLFLALLSVFIFAFWQKLESEGASYYRLVLPTILMGLAGSLVPLVVAPDVFGARDSRETFDIGGNGPRTHVCDGGCRPLRWQFGSRSAVVFCNRYRGYGDGNITALGATLWLLPWGGMSCREIEGQRWRCVTRRWSRIAANRIIPKQVAVATTQNPVKGKRRWTVNNRWPRMTTRS